ncbi:MAG: hypothetical protein KAH68_00400 [Draconibacterium sp.]|nr:hypothetical protein [Draconibacterium sp.]
MILKTLKSNRSINLLFVPAVAILFWLKNLLYPFSYQFYPGENANILFVPINSITNNLDFVRVLISLVAVVFIAGFVQVINDQYMFIRVRTKLPSLLFIIIVSGFTNLHTLHPVFPATMFLLFAIYNLFITFEKTKPYSAVFNSGFFIGVGSLFYLNLMILLPAFFIGITILTRESSWRKYIILIIGFIVPLFLAFGYTVITDRISEMFLIISQNIVTPVNHFKSNIPLHVFLSVLVLLTLTGSINIMRQYDSKKVSTRKYFAIFLNIFILSLLSFTFIPGTSQEMLVIIAIPITYLISNLLVFMKSRFWSEFLFVILLGIVIFMQFSNNIF